jgi:hypothetical protein
VNTTGISNFDFDIFNTENAKTNSILAQNFGRNKADSKLIRNVFFILILLFLTRKIAKTHIILPKKFRGNIADFV